MKILLIDIETSPNLVWTFELKRAFIAYDHVVEPTRVLCFAAKWLGDPNTTFCSEWEHGREGMLATAYALLSEADIVIHYNGEKFDERRLNAEFIKMGWSPPATYQRIDLWKAATRAFDLPSMKLDYLLSHLGLPVKLSTGGMRLWIGVMNGEESARKKMEAYNRNDVQVMEPLYQVMRPWIKGHPNVNLYATEHGGWCCPVCGSIELQKRGYRRTQVSVFQRYRCNKCGAWSSEGKRAFGTELRQVAA